MIGLLGVIGLLSKDFCKSLPSIPWAVVICGGLRLKCFFLFRNFSCFEPRKFANRYARFGDFLGKRYIHMFFFERWEAGVGGAFLSGAPALDPELGSSSAIGAFPGLL